MTPTILFILIFLPSFFGKEFPQENNIIILTNSTFSEALQTFPKLFVFFEGFSNRDSAKLFTSFSKLAHEKENYPILNGIHFAKTNLSETLDLKVWQNIKAKDFNLLRLYVGSSSQDYIGGRNIEDILNWIKRKAKAPVPKSKDLLEASELASLIESKEIVFFYIGPTKNEKFDLYRHVIEKYDYLTFAHSTSYWAYEEFNLTSENISLLCINNFDKTNTTFDREWNNKNLGLFLNAFSQKSYFTNETVTFETFEKLFFGNENFILLAMNTSSQDSLSAIREYKKSKWFLGNKIIMMMVDAYNPDDKIFKSLLKLFRIELKDVSEIPEIVLFDRESSPGQLLKYKMFGGIIEASIIYFFKGWKAKEIEPFWKSMPEPLLANYGHIVDINVELFNEKVLNNTQDVIVIYYDRECAQCNTTKEMIKNVAEKYSKNKNLLFTMLDIDHNDTPGHEFKEIPQVFLYTSNHKEKGLHYKFKFEEQIFISFLKEHVTYPWVRADGESKTDL